MFYSFLQLIYEILSQTYIVYILRISSLRSTKWCDFLGSHIFNFSVVQKKNRNLEFFQKLRFLKPRKIKKIEFKISYHFVELEKLKTYTVSGFEIVFHKLIEENFKTFCFEISSL